MPCIEVKWYKGRDKATKAKVMELLTKAMCEGIGCKPEAVSVVFYDVEKSDWGNAGKPVGN
ncbi:4-oxalocrotonate tautomerase [Candidatus Bathyarchaeota archaeon]|nr:4-oxalocrotonate tautomerase [Candidatus Bathyarchaeota archaeon]